MSAQAYFNDQSQQQWQGGSSQYAPLNNNANQYGGNGGQWDMKHSQPYAAPNYPPPPTQSYTAPSYPPPPTQPQDAENGGDHKWGDTAPYSQQTEETGQRLNPRAKLRDPIFLLLFIANLIGFAAVSGIAINSFIKVDGLGGGFGSDRQGGTGSSVTLNSHTAYLLLVVCGAALLVSIIWLFMVRAFAKVILEVALVLSVLLNIAMCIYYFYVKFWSGAIIFLVIAIISVVCYFSMRRRIPLAKLLLQTTIDVSKHHPSVYLVVILGLIVQAAISVWYAFTCVAIYVKWTPNSAACVGSSCSSAKVAGLMVYATFSFYWISQVVANVVLCTLAGGIYGGWYYYGPRAADGTGVPKRATLKAFGRATTLSLGSIAFGSLIVAILELLQTIFQALQRQEASEGDMIGAILACCAACCISCIRGLLEWFNKYAYIEIALYGKGYIDAAKDTWKLMKDRGIDALINDSLVSMVIILGGYINGFLCGLLTWLYLHFTKPAYNAEGQYTAPVVLIAFLIGINLSVTIGSAIDAGVSTIFVGLGEDPGVLAVRAPVLFEYIRQAYPRVVEGVPRHN